MPRKKVRVEKDRSYLEKLLNEAGVDDRAIAETIKRGLTSDDSTERKNAVTMAAKMRGFDEVDKRSGEELEALPIANCNLDDLDKIANRCSYCKHGKFETIKRSVEGDHLAETPAPAAGAAPETETGSIVDAEVDTEYMSGARAVMGLMAANLTDTEEGPIGASETLMGLNPGPTATEQALKDNEQNPKETPG